MKRYGYFQTIFMSFYSRDLYRDVLKNWGAGVVLYLFFLLVLSWALMMLMIQPSINHFYSAFSRDFIHQVPQMTITKGTIKTPEARPYLIEDKNKKVVGIIDTSGKYVSLENNPAEFLLTKTQIFYRDKDDKVVMKNISQKFTMDVKPDELNKIGQKIAGWLWVIIFPFCLVVSFIYRLVQTLIYAVFGKIIAKISNVPLAYSDLLKLSMIALTPVIVVNTILDFAEVRFHFEWVFYFVLAMIYLNFAVQANKDK